VVWVEISEDGEPISLDSSACNGSSVHDRVPRLWCILCRNDLLRGWIEYDSYSLVGRVMRVFQCRYLILYSLHWHSRPCYEMLAIASTDCAIGFVFPFFPEPLMALQIATPRDPIT